MVFKLVFKFLWKKNFKGYYSLCNISRLTVGQCSVLSVELFLNVFVTEMQLQLLKDGFQFLKFTSVICQFHFSELNLALSNDR